MLILGVTTLRAREPDRQSEDVTGPPRRHEQLLETAAEFRELMLSDYTAAIERYATADGKQRLAKLDGLMWPATPPRLGWSFFMSTSIATAGALSGPRPAVAFYHPWSDVYLVTEWEVAGTDDGSPQLVDAEALMGDWLRTDGSPPFSPIPAWVRSTLFKPAALAMTAAEAVAAFEAAVPLASEDGWRSRLPRGDGGKPLEQYNRAGVPLLLAASLHNLGTYHTPCEGEDPRLAPLRQAVAGLLDGSSGGDRKPLLLGRDTLDETTKVLRDLPDEIFAAFRPVSVVLGNKDLIIFLACLQQSDLVLSLVFETDAMGRQALRRVDLVSYGQAYRRLVAAGK